MNVQFIEIKYENIFVFLISNWMLLIIHIRYKDIVTTLYTHSFMLHFILNIYTMLNAKHPMLRFMLRIALNIYHTYTFKYVLIILPKNQILTVTKIHDGLLLFKSVHQDN